MLTSTGHYKLESYNKKVVVIKAIFRNIQDVGDSALILHRINKKVKKYLSLFKLCNILLTNLDQVSQQSSIRENNKFEK